MMLHREWDTRLYQIAESQLGYFTTAEANDAGVHRARLAQLAAHGDIERLSRGVYRLTRYPLSPLGQYMEAVLWPQVRRPGARGVISHDSALAIYGLSNVSPAKVHLTLPSVVRIRRAVPRQFVLHYAELMPHDVREVEGVLVTTPMRTIRDVHAAHLGSTLVHQAIDDGRRMGQLTLNEADQLTRELFDDAVDKERTLMPGTNAGGTRRHKGGRNR